MTILEFKAWLEGWLDDKVTLDSMDVQKLKEKVESIDSPVSFLENWQRFMKLHQGMKLPDLEEPTALANSGI